MVKIMQRMNQGWVHLCNRLLTFMTMDVRRRLAYAISEIAEAFGIPDARGALIRLRLSHEDLSELVGASRPMVSKHLKEFAKAGIFFKQNGRYIVSKEALAGSLDSAMAVDTRDGRLLRQAQRQAPRPSSRRPHAGGGRSQPSAGRALRATS
jgi:biotin operon repressor